MTEKIDDHFFLLLLLAMLVRSNKQEAHQQFWATFTGGKQSSVPKEGRTLDHEHDPFVLPVRSIHVPCIMNDV
jgi:hypothetical protein